MNLAYGLLLEFLLSKIINQGVINLSTVFTIGVISSLVGGILLGILKGWFKWILKKIIIFPNSIIGYFNFVRKSNNYRIGIKGPTIVILPTHNRKSNYWHLTKSNSSPCMSIRGEILVTSQIKKDILLVQAKMKKPKLLSDINVVNFQKQRMEGRSALIPGNTYYAIFNFDIIPPIKKPNESFFSDIALIDQYGNEHWIKKIEFIYKETKRNLIGRS